VSRKKWTPYARWTRDCGGKQDYDGGLLSVSTRYWPDNTAHSSIILNLGSAQDGDGGGDYRIWADENFKAPTETAVKIQVELWVQKQMHTIIRKLGGRKAFKKP